MKTRIITAIVLIAILIPIVYFGGLAFNVLIAVLAGMCAFEMLSICDRPKANIYLYPLIGSFILYSVFVPQGILIDTVMILVLLLVLFACSMTDYGMNVLR